MALVRQIGEGYYGIETEGIGGVSDDVWKRITDAFKEAAASADKTRARRERKTRIARRLPLKSRTK